MTTQPGQILLIGQPINIGKSAFGQLHWPWITFFFFGFSFVVFRKSRINEPQNLLAGLIPLDFLIYAKIRAWNDVIHCVVLYAVVLYDRKWRVIPAQK